MIIKWKTKLDFFEHLFDFQECTVILEPPTSKRRTLQVIRCHLIYVIIQPVRIQIIRMRPPSKERLILRVVALIIILRNFYRQPFLQIPFIFPVKRHPVILRVPHHEDLPPVLCHGKEKPCLL